MNYDETAPAPRDDGAVIISDIRSFFVGGRNVTVRGRPVIHTVSAGGIPWAFDPNGDYHVEQLYAQMIRLDRPRARYPLLLWHGGGMTGTMWESTPDGRPGWQLYFLRAGHDVCVSDGTERGRASFAPPDTWGGEPVLIGPG